MQLSHWSKKQGAELWFTTFLRQRLSLDAFQELDSLPDSEDAVVEWARKHRILAPCVVQVFRAGCSGGFSRLGRQLDFQFHESIHKNIFEWETVKDTWDKQPVRYFGKLGEIVEGRFVRAPQTRTAPIAADPCVEDLRAFRKRATEHWQERAVVAKQFASVDNKTSGYLMRDVMWLVRSRLGETFKEIHGEWQSAKQAAGRIATLIELKR